MEQQAAAVMAAEARLNEPPPPAYPGYVPEKVAPGPPTQLPPFYTGQPVQQVQYVMQGVPPPVTTYPRPSYPSPHNFLALAIITVVVCSILNLTSMGVGIPAIIFSILATTNATSGRWNASRRYGSLSLYLVLATVIYTLTLALVALGLGMGFAYRDQCYYRGYRDDYTYHCYFED